MNDIYQEEWEKPECEWRYRDYMDFVWVYLSYESPAGWSHTQSRAEFDAIDIHTPSRKNHIPVFAWDDERGE